tara:strand:- start:7343 stop:7948 length:606 start_codon:yes stop_codon:yes gene_type:complete
MEASKGIPASLQEVLFEGPVPGESLTKDPNERYPWEGPPRYTSVKEAREKIFLQLLEPNRLKSLQQLLSNGVSVNALAISLLKEGFQNGAINPDLMLNLLEPTMVMITAIAEKSGIEPIIEGEGTIDEEDDEEDAKRVIAESRGIIPERGGFNRAKVINIQPMSVGKDIKAQLDNLNVAKVKESLLQKRNTNRDSLLSKGE